MLKVKRTTIECTSGELSIIAANFKTATGDYGFLQEAFADKLNSLGYSDIRGCDVIISPDLGAEATINTVIKEV